MKNDDPKAPFDRHAVRRKAEEERLAKALRANLKRRKAAAQTPDAPSEDGAEGARTPPDMHRTDD